MASSKRVQRILKNVFSLSLATPVVALVAAGCGGIDTDGFAPVACGPASVPRFLVGITPSEPVDAIELRQIQDFSGGTPSVLESSGTKCGKAVDNAACVAAFDAATSTQGFRLGNCADFCPSHILVVNTGDTVKVIDTLEAAKAFLAPPDNASDAVFLASLAGYSVACGNLEEGGVRSAGSGFEVLATRYTKTCDPIERTLYVLAVDGQGNVTEQQSEVIESESGACIGRRPPGLVPKKAKGPSELGAYLASVAHLEAASVFAFETLAEELTQYGAPSALVREAHKAKRDEVRHARLMQDAAHRYGGVVPSPSLEKRPLRTLEEIALDNAVEGCVRETFGALVGMWQSRFAEDLSLRRVMRGIAADEARHAELSWAIDAWVRPRLSAEALRRIEAKQKEALDALFEEAGLTQDPLLARVAGLPGVDAARGLLGHFEAALATLVAA